MLKEIKINPELLSDKATHLKNEVPVKVFKSTVNVISGSASAEIMTGPNKGKWTTVKLKDLTPIKPGVKPLIDDKNLLRGIIVGLVVTLVLWVVVGLVVINAVKG